MDFDLLHAHEQSDNCKCLFFVEAFVQQICSHTTTNGGVGLHYRPPPQMFELLDTVNKRKEELLTILHGASSAVVIKRNGTFCLLKLFISQFVLAVCAFREDKV